MIHGLFQKFFYTKDRDEKERIFGLEISGNELGFGLNSEDEVVADESIRGNIDVAFLNDVGFSLTHLEQSYAVLAQWQTLRGETELSFSYRAKPEDIVTELVRAIDGMTQNIAEKIVSFATLDPKKST